MVPNSLPCSTAGNISAYSGDASAADLALMNRLAFWLDRDANRMEQAFNQSELGKRDKWKNRAEYRKWTIDKAIAGCTDTYDPGPSPKIGGKAANGRANGQAKELRVNEAADDPHRLARMLLEAASGGRGSFRCDSIKGNGASGSAHIGQSRTPSYRARSIARLRKSSTD